MRIRFNHSLCLFFKIPFNSFFNQFSVQSRLQKRIFPLNLAGFVILLNLILIGAEAEMKIKGQVTDWAENIEHLGQALSCIYIDIYIYIYIYIYIHTHNT